MSSDYSDDGSDYSDSSSDSNCPELLSNPVFIRKPSGKPLKNQPSGSPSPSSINDVGVGVPRPNNATNSDTNTHKHTPKHTNGDERILRNLQVHQHQQRQSADKLDVVDDTDGLDPEQEYIAWKTREYERYIRDRQEVVELEKEKADLIRRSNMTEQELQEVHKDEPEPQVDNGGSKTKLGAFYNDDDGGDDNDFKQKLLARDYKQERLDHSRPTRFKL